MPREPRPLRPKLDQLGQRPLLQGHLRRAGQRANDAAPPGPIETPETPATESRDASAETAAGPAAVPASDVAKDQRDVVRGKATRSPAEVATRRHLEGSGQGPA